MEKKEITRKLKEILSKHEGNTSEGAIYWDSEWVGGKQIPTGGGGYRQEGGKLVCKDKEFYQEMADFISKELDKAREEGRMSAMNELKRAFSKVFYKSGELWFDYLFEDGDTEAEEDAKAVVEGYWEDILSELKDNK